MARDYDLLALMREKRIMSKEIVSKKDPDYALYAGASYELAETMATIDVMLKYGLIPKSMVLIVKFYRAWLDQQRKAWFASVGSTELTKLGFILGETTSVISATKKEVKP